jgi:hypothetical protein
MALILSGTDGLSDVDGSAATPAIRGTDANTGMFFPAADTVAAAVGGAEGMRLTSTGLGIGTSSPATKLEVALAAVTPSNTSVHGLIVGPDSGTTSVGQGVGIGFKVRNTAGGAVGGNNLGAAIYGIQDNTGTNTGALAFYTRSDASTFSERARIDSSGNFGIGVSSVTYRFQVQANAATYSSYLANQNASPFGLYIQHNGASPNNAGNEFLTCWDTAANRFKVNSNGGVANFQANDVNLSDRREKINFAPAKSYLDTICAIPVQTFNYVDQNMEDDPGLTLGVVAQDVQAVAPELVMESNWGTEENPKMRLSIYQTDLQYALMKCIQEQQIMIEQLKADVAALKGIV